jgi:hypothetical protein
MQFSPQLSSGSRMFSATCQDDLNSRGVGKYATVARNVGTGLHTSSARFVNS